MAKRSSSRPLYEFMVKKRERLGGGRSRDEAERIADPGGGVPSLGAGRTMRIPVGYVLLAAAGVILLLIISYMIGAWRSRVAIRAEEDQRFLDAGGGDLVVRATDPLLDRERPADRLEDGAESEPPPPDPRRSDAGRAGVDDARQAPGGGSAGDQSRWGPIQVDPRQDGLHYLVLIETVPEGALRLGEFCRSEGLEAYVIPGHNPRFRRVIALPGFTSRSESDPVRVSVQAEVRRVGLLWKAKYPGESDLRDAYPIP